MSMGNTAGGVTRGRNGNHAPRATALLIDRPHGAETAVNRDNDLPPGDSHALDPRQPSVVRRQPRVPGLRAHPRASRPTDESTGKERPRKLKLAEVRAQARERRSAAIPDLS